MDQQARRPKGVASAISQLMCLTKVDRLRGDATDPPQLAERTFPARRKGVVP
jgi:hypothetical protein